MSVHEVPAQDPAVVALAAEQQAELYQRYAPTVAPEEADRVRAAPQPPLSGAARWLVIVVDGEAAGCVAVQPLAADHERGGTGEVKRLYVRPASRGRGLSRILMTAAEELARQMGFDQLWLETGTKQPEAMALYASSGWAPIPPYGYWRTSPASRGFAKRLLPRPTGTGGSTGAGDGP